MRKWITDQVAALGLALGDEPSTERLLVYAEDLCDIPEERLAHAFKRARREYEYPKLPPVAFLRRMAGSSAGADGRPGPEEAWARMPKGERVEEETVVWCEEERIAYGACRRLLQDGDAIGARMAFKERYDREIAEARALGRPARWTVSTGFDVGQRVGVLVRAVEENKIGLETAMQFVPGEQHASFVQLLAAGEGKGLLTGERDMTYRLPGLAGVLAKMRMDNTLPEEWKRDVPVARAARHERTPEEVQQLRERAKEQIEFLKRSRNGTGKGAA